MQLNVQKNMQIKYAKICKIYAKNRQWPSGIRVYVFAYGAYICTPHFADVHVDNFKIIVTAPRGHGTGGCPAPRVTLDLKLEGQQDFHQQSGECIYMHHMQKHRLLCFCIYFAYFGIFYLYISAYFCIFYCIFLHILHISCIFRYVFAETVLFFDIFLHIILHILHTICI